MKEDNVVLLIVSCDAYNDAWLPCSLSLNKYWPDCPYEKILVTESKTAESGLFDKTICVNTNDWGERLNRALDEIPDPFVFFMLEDEWPVSTVDTKIINEIVYYMQENPDIGIVYLEADGPGGMKGEREFNEWSNEIPFGKPYRLSCAPGIFRKDYLKEITGGKCSAWEFERVKSFDPCGESKRVLDLKKNEWKRIAPPGAVTRGKWIPEMRKYSLKIGIKINYDIRGELSAFDIFKSKIKDKIFNINPELIVKIQNWLYKHKK